MTAGFGLKQATIEKIRAVFDGYPQIKKSHPLRPVRRVGFILLSC